MQARTAAFGANRNPYSVNYTDNGYSQNQDPYADPTLYPQMDYAQMTAQITPCKIIMFVFMCVIVYYLAKIANK